MEYDIKINEFKDKFYYKKGTDILHREDGPAIDIWNGTKEWCINGKYHRVGGPAIEGSFSEEWFCDGMRHRKDGPAIEYFNDDKYWFINGERLSPEKETILNKWWNNKNGI